MEEQFSSAYRAFRRSAYRNKYEKALLFGGKSFTYGALLVRAEYAYNTFAQMGVEEGDRVALWLPDCPDLLASFYGLARMGAVGVLIHPDCSPREVRKQMEAVGAQVLLTTAGRYELYRKLAEELPQSNLILCRPELDMKGKAKSEYLDKEWSNDIADRAVLDRMMAQNRYNALETPKGDAEQPAVVLFGTSSFIKAHPIEYHTEELEEMIESFYAGKDDIKVIYVQNSFATEGGFLAVHSALAAGKTLLWCEGTMENMRKFKPDFLAATEEFFWALRQQNEPWKMRWKNLRGGFQIGKELTDLMQKFASRTICECGGSGALEPCPAALKTEQQGLLYVGDFGVRLADMEEELATLPSVSACRVCEEGGGLRLRLVPSGKEPAGKMAKSIAACCRREMNPRHLPKSVEFCAKL